MVWHPSNRDLKWVELYNKYKGKMDADFGKIAFTTPPLAAYASLDAKFTTTDLAKELKTWALFGPPLGRTWMPSRQEREKYPDIRPLVSQPWTVLHPGQPPQAEGEAAVDLDEELSSPETARGDALGEVARKAPAWRGTLFPRTDADVWLSTAFASYERVVALEKSLRKGARDAIDDASKSFGDAQKKAQVDDGRLAVTVAQWKKSGALSNGRTPAPAACRARAAPAS